MFDCGKAETEEVVTACILLPDSDSVIVSVLPRFSKGQGAI